MAYYSLADFKKKYKTHKKRLKIGNKVFYFHVPDSIDKLLDPVDPLKEFPLWARIWEAAILLALEIVSIPPTPNGRILEIGAGLGVVGIVASCQGHNTTITEYDSRALDFIRANVVENACTKTQVLRLDWYSPKLEGQFDLILGSEVVYRHGDFIPLHSLFHRFLKPHGRVILAEGLRKTSMDFFSHMSDDFHIQAKKKTITTEDETVSVILATMRPKMA